MKEPVLSLTAKDFDISFSRGSGKGGQKRNKTETKVRVYHPESKAEGISDDSRSQHQNKKIAFHRCVTSSKFQNWLKIETYRAIGKLQDIEDTVDAMMARNNDFVIEGKENGKWTPID